MRRNVLIATLGLVTLLSAQRLDRTILLPDTFSAMLSGNYIAVNPFNGHVFVAGYEDSHIVVVDGNSRGPVTRIPTGARVTGLLFVPELNRLCAGRSTHAGADTGMLVIDGTTSEVLRTIPIARSAAPAFYTPDRHKLYCSVGDTLARLRVVDTETESVIGSVAIRFSPSHWAYNRQRGHIYASGGDAGVSIIDAAADTLLRRRLPTPYSPAGLCYSPTSNRVYVASMPLWVFDDTSYQLVTQIDLNGSADELLYDSLTNRVYCSSRSNDASIVVVNCADDTIHQTYALRTSGATPQGLNSCRNQVYVMSSDSIWVIDDNLDSVIGRAAGGSQQKMVWDPLLDRWYGLSSYFYDYHCLNVFDGAANAPLPPIRLGFNAHRLCFNPFNGKLHCADDGSDGAIAVITPEQNRTDTIIESGSRIEEMFLNETTNRILCLPGSNLGLTVLDAATNQVHAPLPAGQSPANPTLNPVQNRIYVSSWPDSAIVVIDGNADTVVASIRLTFGPGRMAFNSTLDRLYVANSQHDSITVIDGATNVILPAIPTLPYPNALVWNPLNNRLYCGYSSDAGVSVVDCASGQEIRRITGVQYVERLKLNTVENKVYAIYDGDNSFLLAVIDANADSLTNVLPVYGWPDEDAAWLFHAATNRLFISSGGTDPCIVEVIDGHSDIATHMIPVGAYPEVLAADPATGSIYTPNNRSSSISVIRDVAGITEPPLGPMPVPALNVAPNPCRGILRVACPPGPTRADVVIHDVTGRTVQRLTLNPGKTIQLDLRARRNGVYFISVPDPQRGTLRSVKFLLAR